MRGGANRIWRICFVNDVRHCAAAEIVGKSSHVHRSAVRHFGIQRVLYLRGFDAAQIIVDEIEPRLVPCANRIGDGNRDDESDDGDDNDDLDKGKAPAGGPGFAAARSSFHNRRALLATCVPVLGHLFTQKSTHFLIV